jgi:nucleotide-binding universal stress UspA family protein
VVVGKRGTGRFAAALLGSSALQVAQHAPCPVLIVPDGHPPERVTSIVVGTDGSPLARQAVRYAIDLAGLVGAPLTVAYVVDEGFAALGASGPEPAGGVAPGVPAADDESALDAAILDEVDRCCADVADAGIEVRRLVEVGDAAGRLVEISSAPGTVVVVGSRGSGGFDDLRLGSVSHRVIHHAASPVVVVRSSPPV